MRNFIRYSLSLSVLILGACNYAGPELVQQPSESPATVWTGLDQESSWRGYKAKSVPEAWVIENGVLHLTGQGKGGDLISAETYESFELRLQWKISPKGNSGIMFHVEEGDGPSYFTGPEMQVLDNAWFDESEPNPKTSAGANYALHGPPEDNTRPVGEWNDVLLIVNGNSVQHWMNDKLQCSYELHSDSWKAAVAGSKFKQWPTYGMAKSGHIALQDHGNQVWFRSIEVKRLD